MPVSSYKIEVGAVQRNGLLAIVERYLRDDGSEAMFCSQVNPKANLDAHAAERIAALDVEEAVPKPEPDAFEAKVEAAREAYRNGDAEAAKAKLAEAAIAIDTKAVAAEAKADG